MSSNTFLKSQRSHPRTPMKNTLSLTSVLFVLWFGPQMLAQPIIQSINPPNLVQRTGEHAAFVVTASGSGTLTYQWYFAGAPLAGQTSAALVLTNIQPANSGIYGV